MDDLIKRQDAIDALDCMNGTEEVLRSLPSAYTEVIPHRNYEYLSDFWCECGWHLGRKGEVNFCANCGKAVKWDG